MATNWNARTERWAAWKALQQRRKENGEAYIERCELGYKAINKYGQHYCNYATSARAEQTVLSLNNTSIGPIGDWNRSQITRRK